MLAAPQKPSGSKKPTVIIPKGSTFGRQTQFAVTRREVHLQLEFGPMPNVMAALPNIGGALCSTPKSLADAQYWNAMQ